MTDQPTGASAGDRTVLEHIAELVAEEKALRAQHAGQRLGDDDRARLSHLEVQLDQAWDLLRQRRAEKSSTAASTTSTSGPRARSRSTCSSRVAHIAARGAGTRSRAHGLM